jgi:ATP-binding cassette subfamily F protein uup
MVAQRGSGVQARTLEKTARPKAAREPTAAASPSAKRRLSFNEQHDLKTLPARIAELAKKIARLQEVLADPTLYARDAGLFEKATQALAGFQAELADAEDRWLNLEMLREELGG